MGILYFFPFSFTMLSMNIFRIINTRFLILLLMLLSLPGLFVYSSISFAQHPTSTPEFISTHFDVPISDIEFIFIKGGCYQMGDLWNEGSKDELPVHIVCVDSFYIGKYEITQGQWKKMMGENPSKFQQGDDYPVENISWNEAQEFISRLGSQGKSKYRMPTEAEWEYAARLGHKTIKYASATGEISHDLCNFDDTEGKDKWDRTSPVGSFTPLNSGIHDMCGNVWEWVEDSYKFDAYNKHSKFNPLITKEVSDRVIRGCGWSDDQEDCRVSYRDKIPQDCPVCSRRNDIGFRVVRER